MFALRPRIEIAMRVFLTAVIVCSALIPTATLAKSGQETETSSADATETDLPRSLSEQKPVYFDAPEIVYPQQTSPEPDGPRSPVPPKDQVEFTLTAEPAVVPENGLVKFNVYLHNHSEQGLTSLVFTDVLETGLEYSQDTSPVTYDSTKREISLTIENLPAGEEFAFSYSLTITSSKRNEISGKIWLHNAELNSSQSNVHLKTSLAFGHALTAANAQSELAPLQPNGGWNKLGRVSIHMEKDNVGKNALVVSSPTKIVGNGPALQFRLNVFETSPLAVDSLSEFDEQAISLTKESDAPFKAPAFLEINLDGYVDLTNVPAGQEPYVATYDETHKIWVKAPILEIDHIDNSVTVEAAHFSTWGAGLGSSLPQNGANVLLFDQPYTSLFTGSSRYSIPVWTPAGRAGMQPDISLSYSSGTVDGVLGDVQAPWVGVGWNIDDVEIVRKITTDENGYGYRDEYALTLNGSLYQLTRDDFHPYRYFTDQAAFLYIERHNYPSGSPSTENTTGEWWEVVTTDGTRYRLGWNEDSEQLALMYGYSCTTVGSSCWPDGAYASLGYAGEADDLVAMRWRVDRVSDTHGNYMEYDYSETQPDPTTTLAPFDRESYMHSISYTGFEDPDGIAPDLPPAYQIVFNSEARSTIGDVPTEFNIWDNLDARYLSSIWSCLGVCETNGSNAIRKYEFGYSLANVPNTNGTLTLTSLDITGGGYTENGQSIPTTHAPTIRFTYQDKDNRASGNGDVFKYPRLATIDNGSGGLLTFNYEHDGRGNNSWYDYRVQNVTVDSGMGLAKKQSYTYVTPVYSGQGGNPALGSLTGYTMVTESLLDFANNDTPVLKTKHTFGTMGLDIGREMQTEWLDNADTVLRKTTNTYVTDNIGAPKDDNGNPFPGWNYRYLAETVNYARSGGTLTQTSKTGYYNDPYTGHPLVQSMYLGNSLYRKTYYEYMTNPDIQYYILDKVSRVLLVNASNQIYSDTRYHYDGGINQAPTRGDLTLVQKLTGNPNQLTRTVDTVTGYNIYGNAISAKAYRDYGTVNVDPTAAYWESTTTYDSVQNDPTQSFPITVTNALGQSSSSVYLHTLGVPYQTTDPNGWTTSTTYDGLGRTLSVTLPGLEQPGMWYTYPSPDPTTGRLSAPHSVEMQILDTIASKYRSVWGIYDGAGRMLQTQVDAGDKLLVNTSLFNAQGLARQQSLPYEVIGAGGNYIYDPGSQFTTTQYDALGRATSVTAPGGIASQTSYDGLTTTSTDPNGKKVSRTTDGLGRMISVAEFSDETTVYATTTYFYDSADRLIKVKDAKLTTTTIQYDWLGRKLEMDDPDMGIWSYEYDSLGNMNSQTDARAHQLTFVYDALNRLTTKSDDDPATADSVYTYGTEAGLIGLRVGMSDPSGSTAWSYSNYGRTVSEARTIGGEQHSITTNADWLGRAMTTTYDDGEVLSYTYDELGRPDQLKSNQSANTLVDLAYNVLGQIQTQTLGNGTVITNTYDFNVANNTGTTRLTNRTAENGSTTQLNLSYEYDSNGNITRLTDNQLGETQFYDYDFLNRLTSAIGANGTPTVEPATPETYGQEFEYDKVGNIEQINNWGTPPTQQQGRAPSDNFAFVNFTDPKPQAPDKALLAPAYPQLEPTETPTETPTPTETGTPTNSPTASNTPVPTNTPAGTSTPSLTPTPRVDDAYTVALLHMNGADGSTTFTDETGKTWTAAGNAQIDTAQSMFGGASGLFDGSGDYLTAPDSDNFYFNGDFTIDFWVRFNSVSTQQILFHQSDGVTNAIYLYWESGLALQVYSVGGLKVIMTRNWSPAVGTWYHVALTRSGNDYRMFVNGTQLGETLTDPDAIPNVASPVYIGANYLGASPLNGWLDDYRVSKGVARWTSDFTPPSSEHVFATATPTSTATYTPTVTPTGVPVIDDSYSVSLLHMQGADASTAFVDESRRTWTRGGNAQIDTAQSVFGGSSGLFDGAGDFLTAPDSDDFYFNGDFTIDFWVRFNSDSTQQYLFHQSDGVTNAIDFYWGGGALGLQIYSVGGLKVIMTRNWSPVVGTWHHVALTRSGNDYRMFIDGEQLGATLTDPDAIPNVVSPVYIGISYAGTSPLNGWLDEYRVSRGIARWTSNFTPPASEYAPTAVMSESLMAHWDFEGVTATPTPGTTTFHDVAPYDAVDNVATLQNEITIISDGASGDAVSFDGVNDYVTVADQVEVRKNSSFTLSAWINPSVVESYHTQYIVNKGISATDFDYGFITTSTTGTATPTPPANVDTNGKLVFRVGDLTPNKVIGPVLPVNTWTLVTGVYDHAKGELRLYINGTLSVIEKVTGTVSMGTGVLSFSSATNPYYGRLDEVRFYNRALTDEEVTQLSGTFVTPTPVTPSPTPIITPVGAGTYDDTNSAWKYSGTWTAWTGSGPYNSTSHYTGRVGNSAELTFTGTKFTLTYAKHSTYGLIDVYMDDVKIDTINAYNATVLYNQTYTSPTYSAGTHTVRLVYAGGGTYIDLDAIQVYDTPLTPVGAGTYDDTHSAWNYSGNWTAWTGSGPYNNTSHYTGRVGNSAELTFTGTKFTLTYAKHSAYGLIDVYVDGAKIDTLNAYNATTLYQQTYTSPTYSAGTHTVRLVYAGGGTSIDLDAIQVYDTLPTPIGAGVYDDTHNAWLYSGTWTAWTGSGPLNNSSHYTSAVGNFAELTFTGTKFVLTYAKHSAYGLIDVYVDGIKIDTISTYNATTLYQQTYTSPVYSAGNHTVRLVYAGGESYIDLDAIQIYDTPDATSTPIATPVGAGTYDDTNIAWKYSGTWIAWTGSGPTNNTEHYTNMVGAYAELLFNGTQFTFTYEKVSNRGFIDIYVDGTKIDTINAYSATTLWQPTYTSPVYAAGTHTVRFVHAGGSGTYIDVDAIRIYDAPPTPIGVGTYDDTHSAWNYVGSWTAWAESGYFNSTEHYTDTAGNFAELSFNGTQFTLTYFKIHNRGLIDIYVDGTKIDTINAYNATALYQQTYTSPIFSAGTHAVRFVHAGGSGTYIDIDAIQILDTPLMPVGVGTYDDTNSAWRYAGSWIAWTGSGPYNNTEHYTSTAGDYAELLFNGTQFTMTYIKASNRGLIDVYVDGTKIDTINAYNASVLYNQTYTSPAYSAGIHTVRLVHGGNGTYIDIDAIQILDTPPPTPTAISQGWYTSDYTYSTDTPHAVTGVDRGSFTDSFTYDDNGNMTCRTESGVTYVQTYSAENRIASIQKLASGTCAAPGNLAAKWDFTYDGDGVRTGQSYTPYTDGQPGTVEITRYYFGGAYETRTDGTIKKYYSFAGQTIAMRTWDVGLGTWNLSYFLSDHLGSVSVVLSATGTVLEQQRYLPFGGVRTDLPSPNYRITNTDFTYTGQRNLPDTGLMDYKARFYSPYITHFSQPDTIVPNLYNPQSLNRYAYALNNPIRYIDPTGHKEIDNEFAYKGKKGCTDPKYCRDGKPKPKEELERMRKPHKPSGSDRNRDCSLFDRICNTWVAVDHLFDPYTGAYPYSGHNYNQPFPLTGVSPATFNPAMADAYAQHGIDLSYYAANSQSNPLTESEFASWELSEDLSTIQLYKQVLINKDHKPYGTFLLFAGVPYDDNHIMNYESNYLSALMETNPAAVRDAKEYYMNNVVLKTPSIWQQLLNEGTPLWPASGGPPYE